MDVKEAAKIAATYTTEIETVMMPPEEAKSFLKSSGFAFESVHFDDDADCWRIGVGFVREFDREGLEGLGALSNIIEQKPLQGVRTYKTVVVSDDSGEVVAYE